MDRTFFRGENTMTAADSIVLIGMPGVGKSTVGMLLAKRLGKNFLDTDLLIQAGEKKSLQEIIFAEGLDGFLRIEERHILSVRPNQQVIATGGSVVYSAAAMAHLARGATIVFLDLAPQLLESRLADIGSRGVVMGPGQTIFALHAQRHPLYQRYAHHRLLCDGLTPSQTVDRLIDDIRS